MRIDRETEGVDTRIHSVCVLYKPRNELKKVEYVHILTPPQNSFPITKNK
jgi:hypothetical protein